jgi:hypothetical protein
LLLPAILSLLVSPAFIWISLAIAFVYLALVVYRSIKLADRHSRVVYIIWSFCVLHFSYGFGSLLGLFHLNKLFK